ncbi:hypothetical protein [Leptospira mayottensis]|uniref:hypothetical protein n=1 Tax=Leptospira mayottensis TaxID=1137606 RepID=UPI000E3594C2|nr:hypothetical protein [Leptospira mayottensis]AXR68056.1 hypothetical protein DPV73_08535 [Leptospira mayottensis]
MIRGNSYVFALLRALGADFFSQVLGQVLNHTQNRETVPMDLLQSEPLFYTINFSRGALVKSNRIYHSPRLDLSKRKEMSDRKTDNVHHCGSQEYEVKILLEAFSHFLLRIPLLLCFIGR